MHSSPLCRYSHIIHGNCWGMRWRNSHQYEKRIVEQIWHSEWRRLESLMIAGTMYYITHQISWQKKDLLLLARHIGRRRNWANHFLKNILLAQAAVARNFLQTFSNLTKACVRWKIVIICQLGDTTTFVYVLNIFIVIQHTKPTSTFSDAISVS